MKPTLLPVSPPFILPIFFIAAMLAGCFTTREVTVDYPLEPSVVEAINRGGTDATVVLADSHSVTVKEILVDSVMARWLEGEWVASPLANVQSITFIDPAEAGGQLFKGIVYSAAGFGALGLIGGLAEDHSGLFGEVLEAGAIGGLMAGLTYDRWRLMTDPRVCYTIRPPQTALERTRREADKMHLEAGARDLMTGLNVRNRKLCIAAGAMFGSGNSVNAESDASKALVLGGEISFAGRFWERAEIGLDFGLASHIFGRASSQEKVNRLTMMLTGTIFPLEGSGFFIRGGLGFGLYSAFATYAGPIVTLPPVAPATVTASGFAFALGCGYDLRIGEAWSIRPAVRYTFTPLSGLELNDTVILATGRSSQLLTISLGVVFNGVI